ncbi:MAG: response regulator [Nitrospirae bacterium]|nr:response regulator [Nitrospirota bacterium]
MNELPKGGNETILVAEDDETLRKLTETVLSQFGYAVILAEDGDDAIEKFKTHNDVIRLVILDMIMPGKSGREAYDSMKVLKPDIRALFASGYTADIIQKRGMIDPQVDFVTKPLSPIDLLRKVREILDR